MRRNPTETYVSVAMFLQKRVRRCMGLSLLCSGEWRIRVRASVVLSFQVLLRCMMGMRWMDTRQLVAYNHMFINFNRVGCIRAWWFIVD